MSASWLSRFQWSVRALAQPKAVQATLFPDVVALADELALEFEECHEGVRAAGISFPEEVLAAIGELDRQLEAMSSANHPEFWTDESLDSAEEWQCVRRLALHVLEKMGWPNSSPGRTSQIYVGSDG